MESEEEMGEGEERKMQDYEGGSSGQEEEEKESEEIYDEYD